MRVTFIGHLSKDINIMKDKEQIIPGGGVYYGAFVTRSFGAESYVYTKLASKDTELFKDMESYGIRLVKFTSKVTTTIQNLYPTDNPDDRISKMVERADPFTDEDIKIIEKSISIVDIYQADEVFLTNAIRGIRWVESVDEKLYVNTITKQVFSAFKDVVVEHFGEHLV